MLSNVEELQKLVTMSKLSLGQKEHENTALREQVRQFEARWSEHEVKMKSVEETWLLYKRVCAAKKSLGADDSGDDISRTQNPVGNSFGNDVGVCNSVDNLMKV